MAGITGIFLAIPVIAILTVTYRHWLEHRGSKSLVADLLKPAEQAITAPPSVVEEKTPVTGSVQMPQAKAPTAPPHPTPPVKA